MPGVGPAEMAPQKAGAGYPGPPGAQSLSVPQTTTSDSPEGRNSLAVLWLRLHASNTWGMGLMPGQRTKIPHAHGCGQKKKKNHQRVYYKYGLPAPHGSMAGLGTGI